jgi:signal transduction histidine kinase
VALRLQTEELRGEGWDVSYEEDLGEGSLAPEIETALYRIAQEALNNARKYAGSTEVRLRLTRRSGRARLEVRARGRDFDPSAVSRNGGLGEKVGLAGMRERISLLGGELTITSRPGSGISVVAEVPLPAFAGIEADHDG